MHPLRIALLLLLLAAPAAAESDGESVAFAADALIFGDAEETDAAVDYLTRRGDADVAASAILALRFGAARRTQLVGLLQHLTGHKAETWHDWMLWQEVHPEIRPHPSFRTLALKVLQEIDPNFLVFFPDQNLRIRLEEIAWGGVPALDGIPALDRPARISAADADYLLDDDLVFGIAINGEARAYPLRILGWHEMVNDVLGGVPVALAYCTLCGAGILYETWLPGRAEPFVFGSSGLLYRSNKLMFDWETLSLWNQFTGEPVSGPLADSGLVLRQRPIAVTSWAAWRARQPETSVLSLDTGYTRDYGSGVVYSDYFDSAALMFPAVVADQRLLAKDFVFGMRTAGAAKAWPLSGFAGGRVIDDALGRQPVVLIGWESRREVLAYDRGAHSFAAASTPDRLLDESGTAWTLSEEALIGPGGERLSRLPGHVAYWFAWDSFVGVASELYEVP
jgi:hypothetical protein